MRTEEICEEEREKSVHQKEKEFRRNVQATRHWGSKRGIGKVKFLNGWMRKI